MKNDTNNFGIKFNMKKTDGKLTANGYSREYMITSTLKGM